MQKFFCVVCEAIKFNKSLLCSYCEEKMDSKSCKYFLRFEKGISHYYLFNWTRETDTFCRGLAYSLKNQKEEVFREWGCRYPSDMTPMGFQRGFVPKASTKEGLNHALGLAQNLKELLHLKSISEVKVGDGSQKKKSRRERLMLKKSSFEGNKELVLDCGWVFIDDVFVTGGTYNKVKAQIGSEPEMIVTMFYKQLIEEDEDEL